MHRSYQTAKAEWTLTPAQLSAELEAIPPVHIKNKLMDLLEWQATHGKTALVHASWYFRHIIYSWRTRADRRLNGTPRVGASSFGAGVESVLAKIKQTAGA